MIKYKLVGYTEEYYKVSDVDREKMTMMDLRKQYSDIKSKTGLSYSWQDWLACATINGLLKNE